ncbi:MAG: hypothetical protein AAB372_03640 [Patescibacteria group bacterium]
MAIVLFVLFVSGLVGMTMIPLRHMKSVRTGEGVSAGESLVSVKALAAIEWSEQWYRFRAREESLKLLDRGLKVFERGAGQVAGKTKNLRILVQERFQMIPRESLYWKEIRSWKRESGPIARPRLEEDGWDISNHQQEEF